MDRFASDPQFRSGGEVLQFFLPIPAAAQIYTVEAWRRQGWNGTVDDFEGAGLLENPLLRRRGIQHCSWQTLLRKGGS